MSAALVRRPGARELRLGRSFASAVPGELVVITPGGEVYRPTPVPVRVAASGVFLTVLGVTFGLPGLASGGVALAMLTGLRLFLPDLRRFRTALAAHAAFAHADALAALDGLAPEGLPRRWRPAVSYLRARILARLGRLAEAEAQLRALVAASSAPNAAAALRRNRWLFAIQLVDVLAAQGDVASALALRPQLAGAPPGSYFQFARAMIDAQLVLAGGPARLLDDLDVFEPARLVLSSNVLGEHGYLCAFAFERQGDLEMARHLFAEAASRAPDVAWRCAMPRLARWVDDAGPRLGDTVEPPGV